MTKIISALALIKSIFDLARVIIVQVGDWLKQRASAKRVKEIKDAQGIPKTDAEAAAEAACKVEKVFNPDSDCDSHTR